MTVPAALPRTPPTEFPPAPESRTLRLPGGASLTGMADLPQSLSDQCQVSMNLMLQLGPFLCSMECVIKLLDTVQWVLDFLPSVPNPIEAAQKLGELPGIVEDLASCVTAWTPLGICAFIKDVLLLIADFLGCILEMFDSIISDQIRIGIQMGEAQGNPVLLEVLEAAQANADRMAAMAGNSCGPAFALLDSITAFLEMLGVGAIALPSIDDLTGGEASAAIEPLQNVVDVIRSVAEALPC